jgi:DNA modification methylase
MNRIVITGDCLEVLAKLEAGSIDAVVTDPPYHLTTGKKGGSGLASLNENSPAGRARVTTGFMGKAWDGGQIAHDPKTWREVLRVAKPGAMLVAFGGTRTYHRLACAIEDAGWELRDSVGVAHESGDFGDCPWLLAWTFAVGFPKSLNLDGGLGTALKPAWEPIVLARKPIECTVAANTLKHGTGALNVDACRIGLSDGGPTATMETWEQDLNLCALCALDVADTPKPTTPGTKECSARSPAEQITNARVRTTQEDTNKVGIGCSVGLSQEELEGVHCGAGSLSIAMSGNAPVDKSRVDTKSTIGMRTSSTTGLRICSSCGKEITSSCTSSNITPGKSACGQKQCKQDPTGREGEPSANRRYTENGGTNFSATPGPRGGSSLGRWPANLLHDGSPEVVAMFPDSDGQAGAVTGEEPSALTNQVYGDFGGRPASKPRGDSGSATRFFFSGKATRADREEGLAAFVPKQRDEGREAEAPGANNPRNRGGQERKNNHPTVKPTALMRWLVKLITPPGGTVLDPFCGSGSTGKACVFERLNFLGIEREPDYADIARARIAWAEAHLEPEQMDLLFSEAKP